MVIAKPLFGGAGSHGYSYVAIPLSVGAGSTARYSDARLFFKLDLQLGGLTAAHGHFFAD